MIQKMLYGSGDELVILVGEEEVDEIVSGLENVSLLTLFGFDWNEMLSPWPQEKIFKKGEDFAGKADEMIVELEEIVKDVKEELQPKSTYLVGYSLAGLFSLYACTKLDFFDGCASVSGSLWYPNFVEYLKEHPLQTKNIYLSLGDAEKNTKNPIMSQVEECTLQAQDIMQEYADVVFEMNEGGHFNEPNQRILKAISQLRKM